MSSTPPAEVQAAVDAELARRDAADARAQISTLKGQVAELQKTVTQLDADIEDINQRTALISRSTLTRAFTVYGHYFLAQVVIGLIIAGLVILAYVVGIGR